MIKAVEKDDEKEDAEIKKTKCMLQINVDDDTHEMSVKKVCDGGVNSSLLDTNDAFIIDFGVSVYVWIGKKANKAEHREAMVHAVKYLNSLKRDTHIPMCRVLEGKEPKHFKKLMATGKKELTANDVDGGFMGRRDSNPILSEIAAANDKGAASSDEEEEEDEEEAADEAADEAAEKPAEEAAEE